MSAEVMCRNVWVKSRGRGAEGGGSTLLEQEEKVRAEWHATTNKNSGVCANGGKIPGGDREGGNR